MAQRIRLEVCPVWQCGHVATDSLGRYSKHAQGDAGVHGQEATATESTTESFDHDMHSHQWLRQRQQLMQKASQSALASFSIHGVGPTRHQYVQSFARGLNGPGHDAGSSP